MDYNKIVYLPYTFKTTSELTILNMMKKLFFLCLFSTALVQAQSLERQVIGSTGTSFSNASAQMDFTVGELAVTTITDGTTELTQGFHQTNLSVAIKLSPIALLQGPLLGTGTAIMDDGLRSGGYIPTTSPYADALTTTAPVLAVTGNDAIVDWVLVELRDEADNTNIVASTSALLQRDGDVVGTDGTSPVSFDISAKNYFIAVKHRNHLSVMSLNTIALSSTTATVNFSDGSTATHGSNAQTIVGMPAGISAMWAGNTSGNNNVLFSGASNDSNEIKDAVLAAPGNILNLLTYNYLGYHATDVNMNGGALFSGSNNDTNIIKDNVLAHPSNILNLLTYSILEQLP